MKPQGCVGVKVKDTFEKKYFQSQDKFIADIHGIGISIFMFQNFAHFIKTKEHELAYLFKIFRIKIIRKYADSLHTF